MHISTESNFNITNFPFPSGNIPSSPTYGVFISQLIRYAMACSSYECFILMASQDMDMSKSLRKFYGRYGDLIKKYEVPLSRMLNNILKGDLMQWNHPFIRHYFVTLLLNWTLLPNLTITQLREVSIEHLQRVRHANRGRLLLQTSGPALLHA